MLYIQAVCSIITCWKHACFMIQVCKADLEWSCAVPALSRSQPDLTVKYSVNWSPKICYRFGACVMKDSLPSLSEILSKLLGEIICKIIQQIITQWNALWNTQQITLWYTLWFTQDNTLQITVWLKFDVWANFHCGDLSVLKHCCWAPTTIGNNFCMNSICCVGKICCMRSNLLCGPNDLFAFEHWWGCFPSPFTVFTAWPKFAAWANSLCCDLSALNIDETDDAQWNTEPVTHQIVNKLLIKILSNIMEINVQKGYHVADTENAWGKFTALANLLLGDFFALEDWWD